MAEATQFKFGFTELATLLVKERGIHEGLWMATLEFNFSATLMGATPDVSLPTGVMQIANVVLGSAPATILPNTPGLVDASIINPPPKKAAKP